MEVRARALGKGEYVDLALLRGLSAVYRIQIMNLCKQHAAIVVSNVHAHLLHPVCAHGQINQLAKKLVSLLAVSLERLVNARSQIPNLLPP